MQDFSPPPNASGGANPDAAASDRQDTPQVNPPTTPSSAEQLAEARASLQIATKAVSDPHLRRQHAHHAADLAADVILRGDSTDEQRRTAGTYLEDAVSMRDDPTKDH